MKSTSSPIVTMSYYKCIYCMIRMALKDKSFCEICRWRSTD
jgi:hypothetical protein